MNTDELVALLVRGLLAAVVVPPTVYYVFALNRTEHSGPVFRHQSYNALSRRLQWRDSLSAMCAVWSGASVAAPRMWLLALPLGVICGWLIGTRWARWRAATATYTQGGPEPSTPPERRFPSDAGASILWSASASPLPVWLDIAVLIGCTMLGCLIIVALAWLT